MIAILTADPFLARMLPLEVERGGFSLSSPKEATLLLCDAPSLAAYTGKAAVVIVFANGEAPARADHVLPFPYETDTLQALLRRYTAPDALVPLSGGVLLGGRRIALSPTEEKLFRLLLLHRGKVVSEEALRAALPSEGGQSNLLQVLLCRLRRKLSPDGVSRLRAQRGKGYILIAQEPPMNTSSPLAPHP
jgi:DNA-binding winged helix-turn-helix (wHTH) protein